MLNQSTPSTPRSSGPPSPRRRVFQPVGTTQPEQPPLHTPPGSEFIASEPTPSTSHGISSAAFSQNYYKTFFVEEKVLGKGGRGVVVLVRHVLDGVSLGQFACKRVPVGDNHAWLEKVLLEVQLLQNLSHQNLVSYRHVWLEDYQASPHTPNVPCAFILQQYCNAGDLHHYVLDPTRVSVTNEQLKERMRRRSKGQLEPPINLHEPRRMQFEEIFSFFKDITSGLHHLHSNGYIHRDMKPSNCLLHSTGQRLRVMVSDFGEVQVQNVDRKSTGATGTISYCAPEVLRRLTPDGAFGNFTTKSDVFSLGMIVYFMCFGKLPYSNADDINEENEDIDQLRAEIAAWVGFNDETRVRKDLPDKLYRFLKRLLSLNPNDRPSTDEILLGIRGESGLDDLDTTPHPSILDNLRTKPRILPVESPSPTPTRQRSTQDMSGLTSPKHLVRGSLLRATSPPAKPRSPSPPKHTSTAPAISTAPTPSTAMVRTTSRKSGTFESAPTSPSDGRPPSRLALPPPPLPAPARHGQAWLPRSPAVLRALLFVAKYASVAQPCAPYAATRWLAYPLLLLAMADFVPRRAPDVAGAWPRSALLLLVHFAVVGVALRAGVLCWSPFRGWER